MLRPLRYGTAVHVDRNNFQKKLLRSVLRSTGFIRVTELDDIESGLDEARRSHPDFLFADFDTAHESELLRGQPDIRKTYLNDNTLLVILLQNPTRYRVDSAISYGANWVISRPFSPKVLHRRLRALIEPEHATPYQQRLRVKPDTIKIELEQLENSKKMTKLAQQMDELLKQSRYFKEGNARHNQETRVELLEKFKALESQYVMLQNANKEKQREKESVVLL